jgi:hypothetical protein
MARYEVFTDPARILEQVDRLRRHHDHLKALDESYAFMRQKETYARMLDKDFRFDLGAMNELDESHFTSLIVKLDATQKAFFSGIEEAYRRIRELFREFDSDLDVEDAVEIYFDSAHITLKSLHDRSKQTAADLRSYLPVISPVVGKWIKLLGRETSLYAVGLFTNLHPAKGLSVGVKFYPSLPLVQVIRGEVGAALYTRGGGLLLRDEVSFHTMLTHSTGFRARHFTLPLSAGFIEAFKGIVEGYDKTVFGAIHDIRLDDIYVRNGRSDKLISVAEVPC